MTRFAPWSGPVRYRSMLGSRVATPSRQNAATGAACRLVSRSWRQCAAPGSTSSTRTPPQSFGWMKFTRDPAVPRFGSE